MTPYASGPGWTVYHADAAELAADLRPEDHVITDPPYLRPPPDKRTHPRRKLAEYVAADPALIAELVCRPRSAAVLTGTHEATRGILELAPLPRRVLVIRQRIGKATKFDPWGISLLLANVWGDRDRRGSQLVSDFFMLPQLDNKRHHVAELPPALGHWLALGIQSGRVVDPFAGSGALVLGARRRSLEVVAGDINERYCERIARRLEAEPHPLLRPE